MSYEPSFNQKAIKTLLVVSALFHGALASSAVTPAIGEIDVDSNRNAVLGYPINSPKKHVMISRRQYLINWSLVNRAPRWVSWSMNKRSLGSVERTNVFRVDHDLSEYLSDSDTTAVAATEFTGTCIDRGHMVPSADRTQNLNDNKATFIMSNILPQSAYLNRRTWVSLERFLRNEVTENNKEVYVVAGSSGGSTGKIGVNSDIAFPSKNFKVAVIKPVGEDVTWSDMRLLVVELPNVTSKGTDPLKDPGQACEDSRRTMRLAESNRQAFWRPYVKTKKAIETSAGLDLSYLDQVPVLTDDEIDEMIANQVSRSYDNFNLQQIVRNAVETIAAP